MARHSPHHREAPVISELTPIHDAVDGGLSAGRVEGWIDEDACIAYARSTDDPNEAYEQGRAVPLLLTAALMHASFEENWRRLDWSSITNAGNSVHASTDVHVHRHPTPGMAVSWDVTFHSAVQTTAGVLLTQKQSLSTVEGDPLLDVYWSSIWKAATIDPECGPSLVPHVFPEAARERPIGTYTKYIEADQGFRFGGASGDRVGHAIDDMQARSEGFKGKILQGMCTLAICSGGVIAQAAGGDPNRLRRFAGRLARPTYPKQDIRVEMFDAGRTDDGGRIVVFEALQGDIAVIKHGWAVID
ncbi:MAG: MaoC/PaaZ C-terminal domain-containing protein [Acidimicrobiia bacterium]